MRVQTRNVRRGLQTSDERVLRLLSLATLAPVMLSTGFQVDEY
jgi:hypothetical protein